MIGPLLLFSIVTSRDLVRIFSPWMLHVHQRKVYNWISKFCWCRAMGTRSNEVPGQLNYEIFSCTLAGSQSTKPLYMFCPAQFFFHAEAGPPLQIQIEGCKVS